MPLASPRAVATIAAAALVVGLSAARAPAQEPPAVVDADSAVVAATLFPDGARLTRRAAFDAPEGRFVLRVDDLPARIDLDTLRVAGSGAFEILAVGARVETPEPSPLPEPERQRIEDEIDDVEWGLRAAEDAVAEADARIALVSRFRDAATATGGDADAGGSAFVAGAGNWAAAWAALAAESAEARAARRDANREAAALRERLAELRAALDRVGPPPPPRAVFEATLRADAPVDGATFEISYLTNEATWAPLYDVRLETRGDAPSLEIERRAEIRQRTGEAWSGVALTLSTARPSGRVDSRRPRPVEAYLLDPRREDRFSAAPRDQGGFALDSPMEDAIVAVPEIALAADEARARADLSGARVSYVVADPVDALGDGRAAQVLIGRETLSPDLEVRAAPALEATAYLHALATLGDQPIVPGRASIFRDGDLMGRTTLAAVAPGGEADIGFGPFESVVVTHAVRELVDGEEGVFEARQARRARFEMTAENRGAAEIALVLFDAVPYSQSEEVEVTPVGPDLADETGLDGLRGVSAWRRALEPGARVDLSFGYDIRWPEDRRLVVEPR